MPIAGIGPAELLHSVREMLPATDVPVIAKGCGIPAYVDGGIHYHGTPELMGEYACFARDAGIKIIGGCCGTTPEHVAAMAAALAGTPSRPFDEGGRRGPRSARRGRIFRHRRPAGRMPRRAGPVAAAVHVVEACCGVKPVAEYGQSLHTARVLPPSRSRGSFCHESRLAVSD